MTITENVIYGHAVSRDTVHWLSQVQKIDLVVLCV